jgi:hypothetical protein
MYRDAAAKCPPRQACYLTNARFWDCVAEKAAPHALTTPAACGAQPACDQTTPDCEVRSGGTGTGANSGSGTSSTGRTSPSTSRPNAPPAVIDFTGGASQVEKRGFEGTKDMTVAGEEGLKDVAKGNSAVDKLGTKEIGERDEKYGAGEAFKEDVSEEALDNLALKVENDLKNDSEFLPPDVEPGEMANLSELESEIRNAKEPDFTSPDLYTPDYKASDTGQEYDGWGEPDTGLSEMNPSSDQEIMPDSPMFSEAFSKLRDIPVENIIEGGKEMVHDFAKELIDEPLNEVKETLIKGVTGGNEELVEVAKTLRQNMESGSPQNPLKDYAERGFDKVFGRAVAETKEDVSNAVNALRPRPEGSGMLGKLGDKVVEYGVGKALDYAVGEMKDKLSERFSNAVQRITGLNPDDPFDRTAMRVPGLLTGIVNPRNGIRRIREFVNDTADDMMQYISNQFRMGGLLPDSDR